MDTNLIEYATMETCGRIYGFSDSQVWELLFQITSWITLYDYAQLLHTCVNSVDIATVHIL